MKPPRLVMFDLDGTLIEGHVRKRAEGRGFEQVLPFKEVRALVGRAAKIDALVAAGTKIAVCTNKAGVAFGHHTVGDCEQKQARVRHVFGLPDDPTLFQWYEAYGHPNAPDGIWHFDDPDRKPRPGMLLRAMAELGEEPRTAVYVGDMDADEEAAWRAGVDFRWADSYFA